MGLGMDYSSIEKLCDEIGVPYTIVKTEIAPIIFDHRKEKNPCSMCATLRRGALNNAALEQGADRIALGHHLDDVIETTVMAMFYGAQLQGMLPKLRSTNHQGMQLIRPLYTVEEDAIISWRDYNGLTFLQCACRFTEKAADDEKLSKRHETKMIIKALKNNNPLIKMNIFNALHNVCLDTFCEYKENGIKHGFNEIFDENKINNTELEK